MGNFRSTIGHHIMGPEAFTAGRVQAIQKTLGALGIQPAGVKGGRGPRTVASHRLGEANGIIMMGPDLLAVGGVVADDVLVLAPLLLREKPIANHREGRPAGTDPMPPKFLGRRFLPIGLDLHAQQPAVASRPAECGPVARLFAERGQRDVGLLGRTRLQFSKVLLFGRGAPPPMKRRTETAGHALQRTRQKPIPGAIKSSNRTALRAGQGSQKESSSHPTQVLATIGGAKAPARVLADLGRSKAACRQPRPRRSRPPARDLTKANDWPAATRAQFPPAPPAAR